MESTQHSTGEAPAALNPEAKEEKMISAGKGLAMTESEDAALLQKVASYTPYADLADFADDHLFKSSGPTAYF